MNRRSVVELPFPSHSAEAEELHRPRRDVGSQPTGALLLTIPQAARRLASGRSAAYELIGRGELRTVHIGPCHRVPVDALKEFVDRLENDSLSP